MDATIDMQVVEDHTSNPVSSDESLGALFIVNCNGIVEFVPQGSQAPVTSIDFENRIEQLKFPSSDGPDEPPTSSDSVIHERAESLREYVSATSGCMTRGSDRPLSDEDSPIKESTSEEMKPGCKWADFEIDMAYYLMMSGKYEEARKYLKEIKQDIDLDALLLLAECFAIDCSVPYWTIFVDAVIKSDVTIPDLLRWFQQVLRKTPDLNGLLRMCVQTSVREEFLKYAKCSEF